MVTFACSGEILPACHGLQDGRRRRAGFSFRFLPALAAGILILAPGSTLGQVRKSCGDGITFTLSAGVTTQGSLLLAEVTGTKSMPEISGEWDGHATPLWREGEKSASLHGLL